MASAEQPASDGLSTNADDAPPPRSNIDDTTSAAKSNECDVQRANDEPARVVGGELDRVALAGGKRILSRARRRERRRRRRTSLYESSINDLDSRRLHVNEIGKISIAFDFRTVPTWGQVVG